MTSGTAATGGPGFRLRDVAVPAYGPSLVSAIGHGAVTPVLALHARQLGADVSTAALVVALMPVGMLLTSLPAGAVVARIGERATLVAAGAVDAAAMAVAASARSVWVLGAAVLVGGAAWTAFLIARQGFMIAAVPLSWRARALSLLGGMFRVGVLVGPLLGALLIGRWGIPAAFWLAAVASLAAGGLALAMPDLGVDDRRSSALAGHTPVWTVLAAHRRTFLTVGGAVVLIGVSRSVRGSLLPLWADHIGLSASTTSLVFAVAAAIDIAFFLPGGWLMDTVGRTVVAVPVVLATAVGAFALPLTSGVVGFAAVMTLIALGNGLGSGIVMTLGADSAPEQGRSQFLGGWRLCGDVGNTGGPLLVSGLAAVAPLAVASLAVGAVALLGTGWVGYWVRQVDRRISRSAP